MKILKIRLIIIGFVGLFAMLPAACARDDKPALALGRPPSVAPSAPTGVSTTADNGTITVTWTGAAGATTYNIYYADGPGVTKTAGTRFENAASPQTIAGLTNGATYYLVVTAVNAIGESVESDERSDTPQTPMPCLRVRVVGVGNGSYNKIRTEKYPLLRSSASLPVAVVLGDSTGKLVAKGLTENGEITFINPPANATVTAVATELYLNPDVRKLTLHTLYYVNVPDVTITLDKRRAARTSYYVHFSLDYGAGVSSVGINGLNQVVSTIGANSYFYDDEYQTDGMLSFVALGLDDTNKVVKYGAVLDVQYDPDPKVVNTWNIPVTSDLTNVDVDMANIPLAASGITVTSAMMRKGGLQIVDSVDIQSPIPPSVTFNAVPGFGTTFDIEGDLLLDTDNDSFPDNYMGFWKESTTLSNATVDFSTVPAAPSNIAIANGGTDRPTISWSGSDTGADEIQISIQTDYDNSRYTYTFEAPTSRSSIVFPELPAESFMNSFRPGTWWTGSRISVDNYEAAYATGYYDLLTKMDQYYGGTLAATPLTPLNSVWSGSSYTAK